jgi:hypothetical protein
MTTTAANDFVDTYTKVFNEQFVNETRHFIEEFMRCSGSVDDQNMTHLSIFWRLAGTDMTQTRHEIIDFDNETIMDSSLETKLFYVIDKLLPFPFVQSDTQNNVVSIEMRSSLAHFTRQFDMDKTVCRNLLEDQFGNDSERARWSIPCAADMVDFCNRSSDRVSRDVLLHMYTVASSIIWDLRKNLVFSLVLTRAKQINIEHICRDREPPAENVVAEPEMGWDEDEEEEMVVVLTSDSDSEDDGVEYGAD